MKKASFNSHLKGVIPSSVIMTIIIVIYGGTVSFNNIEIRTEISGLLDSKEMLIIDSRQPNSFSNFLMNYDGACQNSDFINSIQNDETGFYRQDELEVKALANDPVICLNQTTTIKAIPTGGSNNYISYSWTSDPPGFTSNEIEPEIFPLLTTVYTVAVYDGINTAMGIVAVTVNQPPLINFTVDKNYHFYENDTIVFISPNVYGACLFDTVTIDVGNPGSVYLWSGNPNMCDPTSPSIIMWTSGISFDSQTVNVIVTSPITGCKNSEDITIMFGFHPCHYNDPKKEHLDNDHFED